MRDEEIRPAVPADVPAVKAVTDAAYEHYIERIGVVPQPMEADHAANVAAGKVFVAEEPGGEDLGGMKPGGEEPAGRQSAGEELREPGGGRVVGLVVVEAFQDHLFLDSIAVHPDAHGRGVGRRLLRFVDAHARALGLPEVRLYTNAMMWENQKIYPRYGYEVVERRVAGPYDRIHYRKRLT
ncbi:GNAT family N-acetyltransferase [Streptomyces sp. DH24]|uniref:GNAT family N-acetyltransferase n=1 Tax=Streptomyces sp. DH24 TaxID=3040123 RepID=UPI002443554B|nr:GNAT family N-acetyltransferase [Streptomyces sp. DH24]MDG9718127.1 GNAT family N-acetyltransferase [Streptomyces sp. DH24]